MPRQLYKPYKTTIGLKVWVYRYRGREWVTGTYTHTHTHTPQSIQPLSVHSLTFRTIHTQLQVNLVRWAAWLVTNPIFVLERDIRFDCGIKWVTIWRLTIATAIGETRHLTGTLIVNYWYWDVLLVCCCCWCCCIALHPSTFKPSLNSTF